MATTYQNLEPGDAFDTDGLSSLTSLCFTEGPAVGADGSVYYSDIENNRIMCWAPDGSRSIWREPSHRTNGQTFDPQGRLYHCEGDEFGPGGGRRVTRTNLETGDYEILTDTYEGARYNSPNDICVDAAGNVYFTDPRYGDRTSMEMELEGVYRMAPDGTVQRIIAQPDIERPNGIAVTQDGARLYLIDSCPTVGGNRKVWCFDLDSSGNPSNQRLVFDFGGGRGGDGMRMDREENLYVAAGIMTPRGPHESSEVPPGIYVISPDGVLKARLAIPEDVLTNLAFGGPDGRTLYITAGKTLFTARSAIPGQVAFPRWEQS